MKARAYWIGALMGSLACGEPGAEVEVELAPLADKPRGITLEMPQEHVLASGGVDTLVDRDRWFAGPGQPPLPIFLNRNGGTYRPGNDDSRANTSIVPDQTSQVTPFSGTEAQWQSIVSCLTDMFSRFNVVIVQSEPPGGEYIEAVISGRPSQLGLPNGVGGVAPIDSFNCRVIPNAIVYAFADVYANDPRDSCETAAQEIAHAVSLDHEYHCPDPMTYLGGCGAKVFRDLDAQCGEYQPRSCNCGRSRQNSVQVLIEKLGPGTGMPPPPPPIDPVPPVVALNSPADGTTLPANSTIEIRATATDNLQIASTELSWEFSGDVFPCPYSGGGGSVTCARTGDVSLWSLRVGQGDRTFTVRARDTAGNIVETGARTIHLGTAVPPPTDTVSPTVRVLSPNDGAILAANTTIQISADVNDNIGLASVELVWTASNDSFPCPFTGMGVTCTQQGTTYTWSLSVGVGTRRFAVRAIDLAGNSFVTPERTIVLNTGTPPPNGADTVAEDNDSFAQSFPTRCGNAIDLVVTSIDEDWFSYTAPAGLTVDVHIGAAQGAQIGVELLASNGRDVIASTSDILAAGGTLRGLSRGPVMLARVTTQAPVLSYRLSATCSTNPPPLGSDDAGVVVGGGPDAGGTGQPRPGAGGREGGAGRGGCGCSATRDPSAGGIGGLWLLIGWLVYAARKRQARMISYTERSQSKITRRPSSS